MSFNIEKFASSFCFLYGTTDKFEGHKPECFGLVHNTQDLWTCLDFLYRTISENFDLIEEVLDEETMECEILIMKAILSRCVKLSENPNYFNFLLVCAFIAKVIEENFSDFSCYTVVTISSLCLKAVYARCYKDFFAANEKDNRTLEPYCENTARNISQLDEASSVDTRKHISSLISGLKGVDHKHFELEEWEEKMFEDAAASVKLGLIECKYCMEEVCECDSNPYLTAMELQLEGLNLSMDVDEPKEDRTCDMCRGKCYRFFMLYKTELEENCRGCILN